MVERVLATDAALQLIDKLMRAHGPLMFHQSGGCCDGSSPMCYPKGEFRVGGNDVYLGEIGGCPVYMDADQFDYWKHTQLIIDSLSITAAAQGNDAGLWTCAVAAAVFRF